MICFLLPDFFLELLAAHFQLLGVLPELVWHVHQRDDAHGAGQHQERLDDFQPFVLAEPQRRFFEAAGDVLAHQLRVAAKLVVARGRKLFVKQFAQLHHVAGGLGEFFAAQEILAARSVDSDLIASASQ